MRSVNNTCERSRYIKWHRWDPCQYLPEREPAPEKEKLLPFPSRRGRPLIYHSRKCTCSVCCLIFYCMPPHPGPTVSKGPSDLIFTGITWLRPSEGSQERQARPIKQQKTKKQHLPARPLPHTDVLIRHVNGARVEQREWHGVCLFPCYLYRRVASACWWANFPFFFFFPPVFVILR